MNRSQRGTLWAGLSQAALLFLLTPPGAVRSAVLLLAALVTGGILIGQAKRIRRRRVSGFLVPTSYLFLFLVAMALLDGVLFLLVYGLIHGFS